MQEMWIVRTRWDESLTDNLCVKIRKWLDKLITVTENRSSPKVCRKTVQFNQLICTHLWMLCKMPMVHNTLVLSHQKVTCDKGTCNIFAID